MNIASLKLLFLPEDAVFRVLLSGDQVGLSDGIADAYGGKLLNEDTQLAGSVGLRDKSILIIYAYGSAQECITFVQMPLARLAIRK